MNVAKMRKFAVTTAESENGYALLEAVAFLTAFIVLTVYVMDTFTAIHTGIVNSIAARTYLFETLQHRSDIVFLRASDTRDVGPSYDPQSNPKDYSVEHQRFHAVNDEDESPDDPTIKVPARRLTQADDVGRQMKSSALDAAGNETNVIWIKEGYGICVDAACPGDGG